MIKQRTALLSILGLAAVLVLGAPAGAQNKNQDQQPIYGSQLMTDQEQAEYRARMRAATSDQERAEIRQQHHAEMQARAAEMGVTLPDQPPARGMGQGMGQGRGQGMGQGPGPRQGRGQGMTGQGQGMMGQGQGQGMKGQGQGQPSGSGSGG